eukprot:scaffold103034_cov67-Phaeocystis_antarctica.AAC.2
MSWHCTAADGASVVVGTPGGVRATWYGPSLCAAFFAVFGSHGSSLSSPSSRSSFSPSPSTCSMALMRLSSRSSNHTPNTCTCTALPPPRLLVTNPRQPIVPGFFSSKPGKASGSTQTSEPTSAATRRCSSTSSPESTSSSVQS